MTWILLKPGDRVLIGDEEYDYRAATVRCDGGSDCWKPVKHWGDVVVHEKMAPIRREVPDQYQAGYRVAMNDALSLADELAAELASKSRQ